METVYLLWHVARAGRDDEDEKLIGVYSSSAHAEAARDRARPRPGFADHPDGFVIDTYRVDEDNWREGFASIP